MEHLLGESFTVDVGHLTEADVVLGRDWLDACSLNDVGPYVDDPSADAIARLPPRFTWSRHGDLSGQ